MSHEGCTNGSKKGGVCIIHGAKVKQCSHEGCTNHYSSCRHIGLVVQRRRKDAASRGVPSKPLRFVGRVAQRWRIKDAASWDLQIKVISTALLQPTLESSIWSMKGLRTSSLPNQQEHNCYCSFITRWVGFDFTYTSLHPPPATQPLLLPIHDWSGTKIIRATRIMHINRVHLTTNWICSIWWSVRFALCLQCFTYPCIIVLFLLIGVQSIGIKWLHVFDWRVEITCNDQTRTNITFHCLFTSLILLQMLVPHPWHDLGFPHHHVPLPFDTTSWIDSSFACH